MKKTIQKTQKVIYSTKCKICNRVMKGFSEAQITYNMKLHTDSHKHDEK